MLFEEFSSINEFNTSHLISIVFSFSYTHTHLAPRNDMLLYNNFSLLFICKFYLFTFYLIL